MEFLGLVAVGYYQVEAMCCAETADEAVVAVRQPAMDAGKGELVCIDWAAVGVHHLAVGSRSVGDLLQMRRLLAIIADPLSQAVRQRYPP